MSSFRADRMWMYNRFVPSCKEVTTEFIYGVCRFIEFALMQHNFVSNGSIWCLCPRCENRGFLMTDIVTAHLYKFGFMLNYYHWVSHGEPFIPILRLEYGVHAGIEPAVDIPIITDDLESLRHENGEVEEHEIEEEIPENEGADEIDRHKNEEELDESDFDSSGDEEDEQSDVNIEYNDSEDNEDNFKKISSINLKNRKSSNNGEGPSLHTGGSVSFDEYRRRYNTFTRNINQKVGETSTIRNEDGFEVQERDVGLNRATEENKVQECNDDNNILTLLQNIPKEQVLNTWIDTIGGGKKGRVYGLSLKTSVLGKLTHVSSVHSNAPTSPTVPPQQVIETHDFEQAVNHVVDQRVDNWVD
ncbi:hypothetical protein GH714_032185 [Hevea brasiliensis]|uniref:Transposase-associated domain-containing protein n=1 Tax=Hevea brasiliensis TaxID=3981 RepID=A0A6A6LWF1_HEVBR|nr:hypothetical protein GH714_032185 [Hevea brasiliensis]